MAPTLLRRHAWHAVAILLEGLVATHAWLERDPRRPFADLARAKLLGRR